MKHLTDANKDKLLAFLRSRAAAGEASLKSWGRDQRPQIPGVLVEEIADALVTDGKATRETRTHGGRVWRAAVEPIEKKTIVIDLEDDEPTVEEEPVVVAGDADGDAHTEALAQQVVEAERALAKQDRASDDLRLRLLSTLGGSAQETWEQVLEHVRLLVATKEKPHPPTPSEEAPAPIEEPVLVAGAAEPCRQCEDLQWKMRKLREENNGVFALRDHLALARQRCAELEATIVKWEREWGSHGIERMVLQSEIASLRQERDEARHNFEALAAEYDRLFRHLCRLLTIEDTASVEYLVGAVAVLVSAAAKTSAEAPAADEDARIRDYLLALPEHLWQRLGAARAKIAKARQAVLDAQAAESKLLAEIGAVLDAPLDEPKAKKPSRPIPGGTLIEKTLELIRTGKASDSKGIAAILGRSPGATNCDLRTLAARGLIERTAPGKYRAKEAAAPLDEPKKRKAVRVGEEPPRDSSLGQTLALVRAGHPGDHKSIADALGHTPEAVRSDLRTLAARGLIERTAPGKYRAKEAA